MVWHGGSAMGLIELNEALAGLMAMQGFCMLAILLYREPASVQVAGTKKGVASALLSQHYYVAFLLFWALAWSVDYIDWLLAAFKPEWESRSWAAVMVDLGEDIFFGSAAYVLVRGVDFSWNDRHLKVAYALLPLFALLFILPTPFMSSKNLLWRLSFGSFDFLLFVAAMVAVGVALFRELRTSTIYLGVIVLAIFGLYALLQLPTTVIAFIDPDGNHPARMIIRLLLAIVKVVLFFTMVAVIASVYRADIKRQVLIAIRVASLLLGSATTLLFSYLHFSEAVRALSEGHVG
jgi:hypothetical protein